MANYYKLGGLIMAMRDQYQQSQEILRSMESDFIVEPVEKCHVNLQMLMIPKWQSWIHTNHCVWVHVKRDENSSMGTRIRSFMNKHWYNNIRAQVDSSKFELVEEDNNFSLKDLNNIFFHPNVSISNPEELKLKLEKLKELQLYSFHNIFEELNHHQSFWVTGHEIRLRSSGENIKHIDTFYNAEDDKIHIEAHRKYSEILIEDLLNQKIPNYVMPDEYITLIDNNYNDQLNVEVSDQIGKRKETLYMSLEGDNKRLVLRKYYPKKR